MIGYNKLALNIFPNFTQILSLNEGFNQMTKKTFYITYFFFLLSLIYLTLQAYWTFPNAFNFCKIRKGKFCT